MGIIDGRMRPDEYRTYQILAPAASHFRPATCAEIKCTAYLYGWKTTVDPSGDLGARQFDYITRRCGRRFTSEKLATGLVEFTFEAGQKCFQAEQHRIRLGKPEIFVVRDGDRRLRTGAHRRFTGAHAAEDWVDHFSEHQDRLRDVLERG